MLFVYFFLPNNLVIAGVFLKERIKYKVLVNTSLILMMIFLLLSTARLIFVVRRFAELIKALFWHPTLKVQP